ncbi:MAG: DUF1697 domain-containing protein [Acidobacteria bacterium]|nr:DUF1697 domain-containing protein [Acidobacteriota bacterium]
MTRYVALLRAINVGGHTVKMDQLRRLFETAGFGGVETFIASGNVIFETGAKNAAALETKIETRLRAALGYDVATFLRTDAELAAVAAYAPFTPAAIKSAKAFNIGFLKERLDAASTRALMAFTSDVDDFRPHQREIYWLCRTKQSDSNFSNAKLEKAIGRSCTFRGASTVTTLAAKYPPRQHEP